MRRENPSLPGALVGFLRLFNRGEYWESHEALEDAWRERDSRFYHGLILYASAFVHARRDNPHGIRAQLEKAERALAPYAPSYLGIDVEAILSHGRRCRQIVGSGEGDALPWSERIPFPTLEPDPSRIRGDEPELRSPGSAV